MNNLEQTCFNCQRSEMEIPVIGWQYQGQKVWVCSECMPLLIHKWHQVAEKMSTPKK